MLKIAIDGPAGAGKSTIAKKVAESISITYIDTGAMYRALTLKVLRQQIDPRDEESIVKLLDVTDINLEEGNVILDGKVVNDEIRSPMVSEKVSYIAKIQPVRVKMVELQKRIAANKDVIMDGRDIASHVMPDANVKIFLTATVEERAKRRFKEMIDRGFEGLRLEDVIRDIVKRDEIDSSREYAPLHKVDDAVLIDSTGKTIEEIVEDIISYIQGDLE